MNPLHPLAACWCRAVGCTRQVPPGAVFCGRCQVRLQRLDESLAAAVRGIDPRAVEPPADAGSLERLRTLAEAVERLAADQGRPITSYYRRRAGQIEAALAERAEAQVPATQGRLIEQHPDTGAYGPRGRGQ